DETTTPADSSVTTDLIIRENYYRNVFKGIYVKRKNSSVAAPIGRIIILQNQFELQNFTGAYGIQCDAYSEAVYPNIAYTNLVIRGNRIRAIDGATPASGLMGIKALSVNNLNIDNNWVDASTPDNSVQRGIANH